MRTLLACGFLSALLAGPHLPPAAADEPKAKPPALTVRLGTIPDIKMGKRPAADEAQSKRIKGMIADLAKLDCDVGLTPGMSGHVFAPVADRSDAGAVLFTDDQVKRWQVLRDLVALGPDALPHLLAALDDKTHTEIVVREPGGVGGMWHGRELDLNPVNPAEAAVHKARAEALETARDGVGGREEGVSSLKSYTVTVGDVCFVAVGQIVGRRYAAVRSEQPWFIRISSPAHDATLCADVRATWAGKESAKRLFDSLLVDYATEGVFGGKSLDGWSAGSDRQCGAATRLLYYFPKESGKLVARRLEKLDVGKGDPTRQAVANGVRAEDLIRAVAWCQEADVRAALVGVFERAERRQDVLAALPAVGDAKLLHRRLEPLVAALPAEEGGPGGDGHRMLTALAERAPESAKGVFQKYLEDAGHRRHQTVCQVLEGVKVPWDAEVLGPLLTDTREGYRSYAPDPGKDGPRLRTRICDEAALMLSANHSELKFTLSGRHADLDKQIAVIRDQLTRKK